HSLLLAAGAAAGLGWANIDHLTYERFSQVLRFAVNDVGMVFFFALAVKEIIEATLPGGPLESPREALVPILAAAGGMIGPAGLYAIQVMVLGRPELMPGWAFPCATDIAFSYLAARFIFPRDHPAIPFLLLLAIADDAIGLILLGLFYPAAQVSLLLFGALMLPALGVTIWLKRRRTTNFWPYVILGGGLSWTALFLGGVHPALALVPILPFMPNEKRHVGLFDPREHDLPDTMNRFEHAWKIPVQFILMFFGLVNAGVMFSSIGPGSWVVFLSLLLGKPLGIVGITFLAVRMGLRAPGGLSYRDLTVMAIAAGIGFTVALFFATAAFRPGPLLDEAKMGALMSLLAAPIAIVLGRQMGTMSKTPRDSVSTRPSTPAIRDR
ncbi:MAG: Na+/H+ antiporter NhaA, partial [Acidobacteriota bacterium]|nr:Na+/H+ antiporter NhaA [Acidobacteriota bacterium]